MTTDYDRALEAEKEAWQKWRECEDEAKKPRPAPPPQQYIRGIPVGHAPAGMAPDCADLKARYDEAMRARELAQDARNASEMPVAEDEWWNKPMVSSPESGLGLGEEQAREQLRQTLKGYNNEELENAKRNGNAAYAKRLKEEGVNRARMRAWRKLFNEEIDREFKRRGLPVPPDGSL